jgi:hypothetical protein
MVAGLGKRARLGTDPVSSFVKPASSRTALSISNLQALGEVVECQIAHVMPDDDRRCPSPIGLTIGQ